MIAHWNIIQGTEEWHKVRWGKVGGTTCAGLIVKSDTLLESVLAEHLEPFELEEGYQSDSMLRGSELEPQARLEVSRYTGLEFIECGWLQCELNPLLGISPDGITKDLTKALEVKCPARKKHTKTLLDKVIPSDNVDQCIHNFTVNPILETLYFVSFRPESKHPLFVKEMTRSTLVDLGTKAKPVVKTVSEWCEIFRSAGDELLANIKVSIARLDSI